MKDVVTYDEFKNEWLNSILSDNPSNVEKGKRFSLKLLTQWLDLPIPLDDTDDIVFCDGTMDGGIDIAYLNRGTKDDDIVDEGDTWYLVQSKYGQAFNGVQTLFSEANKIFETLEGKNRVAAVSENLLRRLNTFRSQMSELDKIVYVFATVDRLNEAEYRALNDIRAIGKERLGNIFDVEAISIENIYNSWVEEVNSNSKVIVTINANVAPSGDGLIVGTVDLLELYSFLKAYKKRTGDLDKLYERNVRKFLGPRGKVNKAIHRTLNEEPEKFGIYNNGITIVVEDFYTNDKVELINPYVVNGCQTTKTIWEVLFNKLEAGGTGKSEEIETWKDKVKAGLVVLKIVKVSPGHDRLLTDITRFSNSQNAVKEKDFLGLTEDFRYWADQMDEKYNIYLEIQRGGWDSQRALQNQNPTIKKFVEHASAFELLKVYGAGWLGEAGIAYGKNPPFLPNGSIFKRIVNNEESPFGIEDLFAAYLLHSASIKFNFGQSARKIDKSQQRGQTRYFFHMVFIELLKDIMISSRIGVTQRTITESVIKLFQDKNTEACNGLLDAAIQVIDEYLTPGSEFSIFDEPTNTGDLNAYLKSEQIGKTEKFSPLFKKLIAIHKAVLGRTNTKKLVENSISIKTKSSINIINTLPAYQTNNRKLSPKADLSILIRFGFIREGETLYLYSSPNRKTEYSATVSGGKLIYNNREHTMSGLAVDLLTTLGFQGAKSGTDQWYTSQHHSIKELWNKYLTDNYDDFGRDQTEAETEINSDKKMYLQNECYTYQEYSDIIVNVANWLIKRKSLSKADCPILLNNGRFYLINVEPKHVDGTNFSNSVELIDHFYLELGSMPPSVIIEQANKLLSRYARGSSFKY